MDPLGRTQSAPIPPSADRERGTVLIAVLIALIIAGIAVVGLTIAGNSDQSLTLYRLEAGKTEMACEAGMQMALREIYSNNDDDGDGVIGGISDDSNAATGISVNGILVSVHRSTSGVTTTLTASAAGTYTARKKQVTLQQTYSTNPWSFFRNNNDSKVWASMRDNTTYAWSAPITSGTTSQVPGWIIARSTRLTSYPLAVGSLEKNNALDFGMASSTTGLATYSTICANVGAVNTRPFDIGVEGISGHVVIAYDDQGNGDKLYYRTYDGTTLSASTDAGIAATKLDWVTCYPEADTNNFIVLMLDDNKNLYAATWNGSTWANRTQIGGPVDDFHYECFAGAYQSVSGDFIAVYPDNNNKMYYRTYHNGAWGSSTLVVDTGSKPRWFHLAANPNTNEVYCALMGDDQKVRLTRWSGSAWDAITTIANPSGQKDRRMFDVAVSPDGTQVVAAYDRNQNTYYYRQYSGGAWQAEQAGYDTGSKLFIVQLHPGPGNSDIIGGLTNQNHEFWAFRWNGSGFANSTKVNANAGSDDAYERFWVDPGVALLRIQTYGSIQP
jgi:hypothetical protein